MNPKNKIYLKFISCFISVIYWFFPFVQYQIGSNYTDKYDGKFLFYIPSKIFLFSRMLFESDYTVIFVQYVLFMISWVLLYFVLKIIFRVLY